MIKSGLADGWLEAMRRAEKARNEISRTRKQETSRTDRLQSAQANQELGQTKETLFPELRFRNAFPSLNDHSMFVSHIGPARHGQGHPDPEGHGQEVDHRRNRVRRPGFRSLRRP